MPISCAKPSGSTFPHLPRRRVALLLSLSVILSACGTSTAPPNDGLRNPRGIALTCMEGGAPQPMATCSSDNNIRAYITGGSIGSISIAKPLAALWVDTDPTIPGFTPLMVGDLPGPIVADPLQPMYLYTTLALGGELVRMDVTKPQPSGLKRLALPFTPVDLAVAVSPVDLAAAASPTASPTARLYLADTAGGAIWRLDTADFDAGGTPTKIPIGGSPRAMVVVPSRGEIYVAHRDHAHVTVVRIADDAIVARISLGPACSDGLDNDGDGKTDGADSGCDGPDDRFEGDPEVGAACVDGKDNDGDGAIDGLDPGCAADAKLDICRDGIDNDGDGKTDFPADSGCTSFASTSETWGAPSCGDGIDNDGDGDTDGKDSDCATTSADTELPAVDAAVTTACNDGIDNDGDGKTDMDDGDCGSASSDGEQRSACADGIDNDGDGKTDLDDSGCAHRGSTGEVSQDTAPISSIAASFSGKFVVITHRRKRAAFVVDTETKTLMYPGTGAIFRRPSTLDARDGLNGVSLGGQPLAITPVTYKGRDAMAVSLQMGGLLLFTFEAMVAVDPPQTDAQGAAVTVLKQQIGLQPTSSTNDVRSTAQSPSLVVEGNLLDLGTKPPGRHANFGPLGDEVQDDGRKRYSGLLFSEQNQEHRTELWQIKAQGQIPNSERRTGRLRTTDRLSDPGADFCRLGVVPGDLLLLHRDANAKPCAGLSGDTLRYRIAEVTPTSLKLLAGSGVVDVPVTMKNQLLPITPLAVPMPSASCFPRHSVHYEVRADGWLVQGSTSGLLSSRGRAGGLCAAWKSDDLSQAARISSATLKPSADARGMTCPLAVSDASRLQAVPYGGTQAVALTPYKNLIWSGTLLPGCAPANVPGQAPTLLPPVRDTTWRYSVRRGFRPILANVGTNPVALISGPGRGYVWVVDQGSGTLYSVELSKFTISKTLE